MDENDLVDCKLLLVLALLWAKRKYDNDSAVRRLVKRPSAKRIEEQGDSAHKMIMNRRWKKMVVVAIPNEAKTLFDLEAKTLFDLLNERGFQMLDLTETVAGVYRSTTHGLDVESGCVPVICGSGQREIEADFRLSDRMIILAGGEEQEPRDFAISCGADPSVRAPALLMHASS